MVAKYETFSLERWCRNFPPRGLDGQVLGTENRESMHIDVNHEIRCPSRTHGEEIRRLCDRDGRDLYKDQSSRRTLVPTMMSMTTRFEGRSMCASQMGKGMKYPICEAANRMVPFLELPILTSVGNQSLHYVVFW